MAASLRAKPHTLSIRSLPRHHCGGFLVLFEMKILSVLLLAATVCSADTLPHARPLTNRTFERTTARMDRGRYLTEGILQCFMCHSERDYTLPGWPPKKGMKGAGSVMRDLPDYRMVAPNLTPD